MLLELASLHRIINIVDKLFFEAWIGTLKRTTSGRVFQLIADIFWGARWRFSSCTRCPNLFIERGVYNGAGKRPLKPDFTRTQWQKRTSRTSRSNFQINLRHKVSRPHPPHCPPTWSPLHSLNWWNWQRTNHLLPPLALHSSWLMVQLHPVFHQLTAKLLYS